MSSLLAVYHYFGAVHSIYCSVNIAMEEDDKAPGGQDKRRSDGPKQATATVPPPLPASHQQFVWPGFHFVPAPQSHQLVPLLPPFPLPAGQDLLWPSNQAGLETAIDDANQAADLMPSIICLANSTTIDIVSLVVISNKHIALCCEDTGCIMDGGFVNLLEIRDGSKVKISDIEFTKAFVST